MPQKKKKHLMWRKRFSALRSSETATSLRCSLRLNHRKHSVIYESSMTCSKKVKNVLRQFDTKKVFFLCLLCCNKE